MNAASALRSVARFVLRAVGEVGFGHPERRNSTRATRLLDAERQRAFELDVALAQMRSERLGLAREAEDSKAYTSRLETQLAAEIRGRGVDRDLARQVLRALRSDIARLWREVANATSESADLAQRGAALASELHAERRERRRAVQFIADQNLMDAYALAEQAPEFELPAAVGASAHARLHDVVDALAPTQRSDAIERERSAPRSTAAGLCERGDEPGGSGGRGSIEASRR